MFRWVWKLSCVLPKKLQTELGKLAIQVYFDPIWKLVLFLKMDRNLLPFSQVWLQKASMTLNASLEASKSSASFQTFHNFSNVQAHPSQENPPLHQTKRIYIHDLNFMCDCCVVLFFYYCSASLGILHQLASRCVLTSFHNRYAF